MSRGLQFFYYDTGTLQKTELVSNLSLSQHNSGTPIKPAGSRFGTTFLGDASASNGVQISSSAALQALVPPMWFACGFMRTAATTESGGAFFAGRAANNVGSQPFFNYGFQDASGGTANNVQAFANSAGTSTAMTTATGIVLPNNTYHAVLGTFFTAAQWAFWADGAEVGTGSGGNSYANVNSGDPMLFYTDFGGPGGFQGNIFWFGVWKGFISIDSYEPQILFTDPYQFLIYPEDEMIVDEVGVIAQPVILRDWSTPQPPPRIDFAPAQQRSQALLSGPQLKPFFQSDWQSWQRPPVIDFAPAQQRSRALLSGPQLKPFFQSDWQSPSPPPWRPQTIEQQQFLGLRVVVAPVKNYDWPPPPPPPVVYTYVQQRSQALLSGPQLLPQQNYDWPKPQDPPKIDFATVQQRSQALLSGPQLLPQQNYDWPTPAPPIRIDFAPAQQRSQALLSGPQLLPVQNYDWPTPALPPWRPQTIEQQFLPQLKVVISLPPQNYDFPRPQPPPDIASSMLYINLALAGPGAPNVVQQDWPLPPPPPLPSPVLVQQPFAALYAVVQVPFFQSDWPVPPPPPVINFAPVQQRSQALVTGPQLQPTPNTDFPPPPAPPRIDFVAVQQRSQALVTGPQLQPPPTQNDFAPPAPPYVINFVGMQPYNLALATFTPPVVTDIHYLPFFSTPGKLKAF